MNIKEQNKVGQWVIPPSELALLAFYDITVIFTLPNLGFDIFFNIFSLWHYHILSHSILI